MSERVEITFGDDFVEMLVERVTARVLEALDGRAQEARWLTGARQAADYLGCSPKRVYGRLSEIPHVKDGGRLLFSTADLDDWLRSNRVP